MTTPKPQQDRKSTSSSVPTSPIEKTTIEVKLNVENEAFYLGNNQTKPEHTSSPSQETNMLDIQPKPEEPAKPVLNKPDPSAPITTEIIAIVPPVPTTDKPTSPVAALAPPTLDYSIETQTEIQADIDIEMTDAKDEPNGADQPEANVTHATPKENGVQSQGLEEENKRLVTKVAELEMRLAGLQSELEESMLERQSVGHDLDRTRSFCNDISRQFAELQQKMAKKDYDYEVMSRNYLEHVRLIRATDDDHSTIIDRLTQLKASIEHLIRKAQGARSVNLNKEVAIQHFKDSTLLEKFPIPEDKLESYHLNLYMESVIMSTLVDEFFSKPLSCIFEFNSGFDDIYKWMKERNEKLAVRWRQQLCVMLIQNPASKTLQEKMVTTVAENLSSLFSKVYTNSNELTKIKDICNKAFELAIANIAQESIISPKTVPLGTDFDEDNMASSLKSNPEGKVALVIFPAFRNESNAFDAKPKVWCY
ncbi:hypothetical protein BGX27_011174 [Mortierella sp. AM989]|nr:hypothetical protein BGX27_011174 [Mortierella sp. AM989]